MFSQRSSADSAEWMVLLLIAVQMPWHAIVLNELVLYGLPTARAFKAAGVERAPIEANKSLVQKRFFAGAAVETVQMPMAAEGFQPIAINRFATALAEIHVLPWPCDAHSITLAGGHLQGFVQSEF